MEAHVAVDESGNTGGNLLDMHQPVFVLASVLLSQQESVELLGTSKSEHKFSTLKRSVRGRKKILGILNNSLLDNERFLISGFHKRFMAVTKMIDLLIEPMMHRDGVDLYERGANIGLSNLLYYYLPTVLGEDAFALLITRFCSMIRSQSDNVIDDFYRLLRELYQQHCDSDVSVHLGALLASGDIALESRELWDSSSLDPAIPALVEHLSTWTRRLDSPFTVFHDESTLIANEQIILEALMSTDEETTEIGYDRRKMAFPIASSGIQFQESSSCIQVQVADILAGSAAHLLGAKAYRKTSGFISDLDESKVLSAGMLGLWPEFKVTPEELGTEETGGIDAVDHIGEYVLKKLGEIPPKEKRRKE